MEWKLEPEYEQSFTEWQNNPGPQSTGQLLKQLNPVIGRALTSYAGGVSSNPTMKAKAKLMAANALNTYDPMKGNLKTHLLSQLRGLQRVAASEKNIIKMPEQIAYEYKKLEEAEKELEDDLGRPPNVYELSDYTGLSGKRIAHIRKAKMPISTGAILSQGEGSFMPSATIPGMTSSDDAWIEYVYDELSDYDRTVMDSLLGLHGKRKIPMVVLAQKLRVSPSALSQRLKKIQEKFDARGKLNIL